MNKPFEITLEDERIKDVKPFIKEIKEIKRKPFNTVSGYHITFNNGYLLSIQFFVGNYCDWHYQDFWHEFDYQTSKTAEIAYWKTPNGELIEIDGDTVLGYQTFGQVLEWMKKISQMEST